MPGFKVACPSCEAPVLIKDPKLVGTKVECPKCKYRFKVEEPAPGTAGAEAAAGAKADAKKPEADKKKKAATPGKNKKLMKIGAGVGAVVLLIVVGVMAFGGGGDNKNKGGGGGGGGYTKGGTGGTGDGTGNPDDGQKPDAKGPDSAGPPPAASSARNMTNLLPAQAVAVYHFNFDKLRESTLYETLTGTQVGGAFQASMGFPLAEVEAYVHCFAGEQRVPFGVLRLRTPASPAETTARMLETNSLQARPKEVKGHKLYAVRSNPFVNAVSHALSRRSLLGEFYDRLPNGPAADAPAKPLGVCVYDNQHILLADYALLDKFLNQLGPNGYPPFLTEMVAAGAPTPGPGAKPAAEKPVTSVDTYRTIEYPLKRALDEMEANRLHVPMLVYAEKFDAKLYDPRLLKSDFQILSSVLSPIADRTSYLGANLLAFTPRQVMANVRLTLRSESDSREIAKDQLGPALAAAAERLRLLLTVPVEFRDYTQGGNTTTPNGGLPGYPMGEMGEPGMGLPGLPGVGSPGMGSPGVGSPGMGSPGYGSPTAPQPGYPGGLPGGPITIPKPGGGNPGYGSTTMTPGFPRPGVGAPGYPMPGVGSPGGEMGEPGMGQVEPKGPPLAPSHLDLGMVDNQLLVAIDLNWADATYRTTVAPRLVSVANQIKGKLAIFSSDFSWHALAEAGPKYAAQHKAFPRGTIDRGSNVNRFGLPYPPYQRVSFFYELLPYLGRGALKDSISPKIAWYDEKNLPAPAQERAGAWVPELLVPYYPQTAWRATSPLAPDHVLGATNYVAIAGVGLDIARENPNSPEFKKLAGITGYDWGSKVAEITDGLSTTIYLMQTPPGLQQPWIAGGGATVRGLNPDDPMAGFRYHHPDGKGGTREGTYALMADGAVRWIPANIDPKALRAMATRAGGDNADIGEIEKVAPKVEIPKYEKAGELKAEPKSPVEKKAEPKAADKKPDAKDAKPADKAAKPEEKKAEPKAGGKKEEPGAKAEPAPAPKESKKN